MQNSPLQEIKNDLFREWQVRLLLKRDDLIHPSVSGNKWRKLKYNLQVAKAVSHKTLLTFGGAFSNHIHAVAAAGKQYGFQTIGVIRGEPKLPYNPTLAFAEAQGMQLYFISRTAYRQKDTPAFREELRTQFGNFYLLPEGGTNELAFKGCAEIVTEIVQEVSPNYIFTCCGTGGTVTGIIQGCANLPIAVRGVAALKGDFLTTTIAELLSESTAPHTKDWSIFNDYHFGGYAKFKPELIAFINQFKQQYQIALDPIYTGKLLFGIFDLVRNGYFEKGSIVVAVHTGGLQGIEGFNERYGGLLV